MKSSNIFVAYDIANAKIAKNKKKFKDFIRKIGYYTPKDYYLSNNERNYNLDDIINNLGLPCVIKSNMDISQPVKVRTKLELIGEINNLLAQKSDILIEEFIAGNDFTVPIVSDDKNIMPLNVVYWSKAKEYKLKGFENAYSNQMPPENEERAINISLDVVKAMRIKGVIRLDFIMAPGNKMYVLELNGSIVSGYHGSSYKFLIEKGINAAKEIVEWNYRMYKASK